MNTTTNNTPPQEDDGKIGISIIVAEVPWERKPELGQYDKDTAEILEHKRVFPTNIVQDQQDAFRYNEEQLKNIPPDQNSGKIRLRFVIRDKTN